MLFMYEMRKKVRQKNTVMRKWASSSAIIFIITFCFRSKSRADEINELINRSQSRAQQMLASGMYGPTSPHSVADPLHVVTPSRDFGAYSNVPVMMMTSPLNRSMMSDEPLRASSPHDPGQK